MDCNLPVALSTEFSRQEYGLGSHSILQGIFLIQGTNQDIPHCKQILYCLSHQGTPCVSIVLLIFLVTEISYSFLDPWIYSLHQIWKAFSCFLIQLFCAFSPLDTLIIGTLGILLEVFLLLTNILFFLLYIFF